MIRLKWMMLLFVVRCSLGFKSAFQNARPKRFPTRSIVNRAMASSSTNTATTNASSEYKHHTELDPYTQADTYPYTSRDMQKVIQVAEEAAFKVTKLMMETSGNIAVSKTKMNAADLVTESDIECQRIIKQTISHHFPMDNFLGEEDLDAGSTASINGLSNALSNAVQDDDDNAKEKLLWIVDPIDGTTNFQAGLPMFCVSIGIVAIDEHNQPVVVGGVIYNCVLNEMVSAVKERGCYINGEKMKPRAASSDLKQALINVGFPVSSEGTLRASSRAVAALATKVRGVRMIASASQVMSWVAQGKLNSYVSWDLNSWDIAAGMVIVEEAGGFISNFEGAKATIIDRDLIVTCKENDDGDSAPLSNQILDILTENDCLKY